MSNCACAVSFFFSALTGGIARGKRKFHPSLTRVQPNNALHLTPPPPVPVLGRLAVRAVSPVSFAVRRQGVGLIAK